MKDIRDAFFDPLVIAAQQDPNIIFLSDDFDAFALQEFKKTHPAQYINTGPAEQNLINVAAGLAMSGKKVFVLGICSFLTSRCFEQIKINLVSMNLPVVIVGVGPGFSFSHDGPTHHGLHDYALMNMLEPMRILNPCDAISAQWAAEHCRDWNGPCYIRLDKGTYPDLVTPADKTYSILHQPKNCHHLIIGTGTILHTLKKIVDTQAAGHGLVGIHQLTKFDPRFFNNFPDVTNIAVVEENIPTLFDVIRNLTRTGTFMQSISAKPGEQLIYGSREYLLKENGLDEKGILSQLL